MRIIVSGHNGFIGKHLIRILKISKIKLEVVNLTKDDFESVKKLKSKINYNDIIFHFAAINRDLEPKKVLIKNRLINNHLFNALDQINFRGILLFTSSTQEDLKNEYGIAKKEARLKFQEQSKKLGYSFHGILPPNIFGPFCKPNYNSFISTFSYMLINDLEPKIIEDNQISLIYVSDFIYEIIKIIENKENIDLEKHINHFTVSEILDKLMSYKDLYIHKNQIPDLRSKFDLDLFNTFRSYINLSNYYPAKHIIHKDSRGLFSEILRFNSEGQISFSTTKKGIIRGNHFHTRKIERFSVISGKAKIQLREIESEEITEFILDGKSASYIDIPIWFTHNIQNIGDDDLYTIFWINEHYDETDPDTYLEKV